MTGVDRACLVEEVRQCTRDNHLAPIVFKLQKAKGRSFQNTLTTVLLEL